MRKSILFLTFPSEVYKEISSHTNPINSKPNKLFKTLLLFAYGSSFLLNLKQTKKAFGQNPVHHQTSLLREDISWRE